MTTLADLIARNAAMRPDAIATAFGGRLQTYATCSARIEALARRLVTDLDVQRGDRVAHLGLNSDDVLVLLFACARIGAMLVPLNWRLAAPELAYIAAHAEPVLLVVDTAFHSTVPPLTATVPAMRVVATDTLSPDNADPQTLAGTSGTMADPLLLVYTSGTTGRPKGAVLTQDAVLSNAVNSWHMHGMTAADHILTVLPMFHAGGLNIQTVPALLAGARVTIIDRYSPEATLAALSPAQSPRPSLLVLVPATMEAILAHPAVTAEHLASLRCLTTGSTIVPELFVERFAAWGLRVIQVYGATETGPIVIYERFDMPRHAPGTTGVAGLLCEARIVDDSGLAVPDGVAGEIVVRGPNLLQRYWRDEAATSATLCDGWFLTGDIGVRDAAGHFKVTDRKKNVIISGGENIYPAEIERVLAEAPGVAECAVIGRPDPRWQEVPIAFVVARPGIAIDVAAIDAHLARHLARFKLPKMMIVRDALPKTALGKVQHHVLRAEDTTR